MCLRKIRQNLFFIIDFYKVNLTYLANVPLTHNDGIISGEKYIADNNDEKWEVRVGYENITRRKGVS